MSSGMQSGQFKQANFFTNTEGLNLTDSLFTVKDDQASDGRNWDYVRTGGIRKRKGYNKVNTSADTQLRSLGISLKNTKAGVKTTIRAADTKLQTLDIEVPSFTNLTADTTTASSTFFTVGSTQPVVMNNFNSTSSDILWVTGGGATLPIGVYSTTKATSNGVDAPTGVITTTVDGAGGAFVATGNYYYAVAYRKTSTQALSNAALDKVFNVTDTTKKVTIDLTGLTNLDTVKYDKIYLYRSAVNGVTAFTTGDLVTILDSTTTSYVDTGSSTTSSTSVPRAGSSTLDNSVLEVGTYKYNTVWKRRLVVAKGNTVYISDLNKSESWPTSNFITLPSGGDITGLAFIALNTPSNANLDEVLCIFKETECWIIDGTTITDWALKFVDTTGCLNQQLLVGGNGYLSWVDRRGVFVWDGAGKPIYISRPIETLFARDGDLDLSKLNIGFGVFSKRENQIRWVLSHKTYGENKYSIKMDVRLTMPKVGENLMERIIEGVFTVDTHDQFYAGASFVPPVGSDETFLVGDGTGFIYKLNSTDSDVSAGTPFEYVTKYLDLNTPGLAKRIHKVILWVDKIGTWDIALTYWSDYRANDTDATTLSAPITTDNQNGIGVWDVGFWEDVSPANNTGTMFWDGYASELSSVVYNTSGRNSEGDAFKFKFSQTTAENPVTISGFSIIYSEISLRK